VETRHQRVRCKVRKEKGRKLSPRGSSKRRSIGHVEQSRGGKGRTVTWELTRSRGEKKDTGQGRGGRLRDGTGGSDLFLEAFRQKEGKKGNEREWLQGLVRGWGV